MAFSFQYLAVGDDDFCPSYCGEDWLHQMLTRLRDISRMKPLEIHTSRSKSLRAHPHDWSDTTRPEGFGLRAPDLRDQEGYQIGLSTNRGRLHGFWIGSVFYIVWLDPDHKLYE